jgi:hypothetical protein
MNQNFEIHGIAATVVFTALVHAFSVLKNNGGVKGIFLTIWRGQDFQDGKQKDKTS